MSTPRKLLRHTAATLASLMAVTAYAAPESSVQLQRSAVVHFSDLDLQRSGDVARLYQRIALSADRLCGPRALPGAYMKSGVYASCFRDTVAQAVASVNNPLLTTYYHQHAGGSLSLAER